MVILRLDLTRVQEVVKHGVRFVFEAGAECIALPVQVAPKRLGVYDEGDGESDDAEDDGSNPGDIPEHRHIPAHFTTASSLCPRCNSDDPPRLPEGFRSFVK